MPPPTGFLLETSSDHSPHSQTGGYSWTRSPGSGTGGGGRSAAGFDGVDLSHGDVSHESMFYTPNTSSFVSPNLTSFTTNLLQPNPEATRQYKLSMFAARPTAMSRDLDELMAEVRSMRAQATAVRDAVENSCGRAITQCRGNVEETALLLQELRHCMGSLHEDTFGSIESLRHERDGIAARAFMAIEQRDAFRLQLSIVVSGVTRLTLLVQSLSDNLAKDAMHSRAAGIDESIKDLDAADCDFRLAGLGPRADTESENTSESETRNLENLNTRGMLEGTDNRGSSSNRIEPSMATHHSSSPRRAVLPIVYTTDNLASVLSQQASELRTILAEAHALVAGTQTFETSLADFKGTSKASLPMKNTPGSELGLGVLGPSGLGPTTMAAPLMVSRPIRVDIIPVPVGPARDNRGDNDSSGTMVATHMAQHGTQHETHNVKVDGETRAREWDSDNDSSDPDDDGLGGVIEALTARLAEQRASVASSEAQLQSLLQSRGSRGNGACHRHGDVCVRGHAAVNEPIARPGVDKSEPSDREVTVCNGMDHEEDIDLDAYSLAGFQEMSTQTDIDDNGDDHGDSTHSSSAVLTAQEEAAIARAEVVRMVALLTASDDARHAAEQAASRQMHEAEAVRALLVEREKSHAQTEADLLTAKGDAAIWKQQVDSLEHQISELQQSLDDCRAGSTAGEKAAADDGQQSLRSREDRANDSDGVQVTVAGIVVQEQLESLTKEISELKQVIQSNDSIRSSHDASSSSRSNWRPTAAAGTVTSSASGVESMVASGPESPSALSLNNIPEDWHEDRTEPTEPHRSLRERNDIDGGVVRTMSAPTTTTSGMLPSSSASALASTGAETTTFGGPRSRAQSVAADLRAALKPIGTASNNGGGVRTLAQARRRGSVQIVAAQFEQQQLPRTAAAVSKLDATVTQSETARSNSTPPQAVADEASDNLLGARTVECSGSDAKSVPTVSATASTTQSQTLAPAAAEDNLKSTHAPAAESPAPATAPTPVAESPAPATAPTPAAESPAPATAPTPATESPATASAPPSGQSPSPTSATTPAPATAVPAPAATAPAAAMPEATSAADTADKDRSSMSPQELEEEQQAAKARLPSGWRVARDTKTMSLYFYNRKLGRTVWNIEEIPGLLPVGTVRVKSPLRGATAIPASVVTAITPASALTTTPAPATAAPAPAATAPAAAMPEATSAADTADKDRSSMSPQELEEEQQAAKARLPSGWRVARDTKTMSLYFYNRKLGRTVWNIEEIPGLLPVGTVRVKSPSATNPVSPSTPSSTSGAGGESKLARGSSDPQTSAATPGHPALAAMSQSESFSVGSGSVGTEPEQAASTISSTTATSSDTPKKKGGLRGLFSRKKRDSSETSKSPSGRDGRAETTSARPSSPEAMRGRSTTAAVAGSRGGPISRSASPSVSSNNDPDVVAACVGLADNWKAARDPNTQNIYYYNRKLGKTLWERPKE